MYNNTYIHIYIYIYIYIYTHTEAGRFLGGHEHPVPNESARVCGRAGWSRPESQRDKGATTHIITIGVTAVEFRQL